MGAGPDKSKGQSIVRGVVQSIGPGGGTVTLMLPTLRGEGIKFSARLDPSLLHPRGGVVQFPEPGDEVLVAFEQGDLNRPYVVGPLWGSDSGAPPASSGNDTPSAGSKTSRFSKAPAGFIRPRRPRRG